MNVLYTEFREKERTNEEAGAPITMHHPPGVVLLVRDGADGTRGACGCCRAACADGVQQDDP